MYFLALPSLLHPSILFNCFLYLHNIKVPHPAYRHYGIQITPLHTESSLTLDNLTSVLKDVLVPGHVAAWLAITYWDQESIIVNQDGSRDRACWEFFLKNHPAPSWKVVAIALWRTADYRALETVMKL